ncbi:unnamed protein product [Gongylonema pulchrum]|uniref:Uncharacterized protein n=1 Tax=Gongylonema pulchrum TaxID=637853 RepID=A0A183DLE2_9BILA|nr:unnamed protein product [Gongylonema pulchrum]
MGPGWGSVTTVPGHCSEYPYCWDAALISDNQVFTK